MDMVQQFAAVVLVLAMLVGLLKVLRPGRRLWRGRSVFRTQEQGIECIGRLALTPQHSLHLVRVGSQVLLVGAGPGGVILIRELGAAATAKEAGA